MQIEKTFKKKKGEKINKKLQKKKT